MTKLLLLLTLSLSCFANDLIEVNLSKKNLFKAYKENALVFSINNNQSTSTKDKFYVIECNDAYGLTGFIRENYVAYNRFHALSKISSNECYNMIDSILEKDHIINIEIEKLNCNYFGCKYQTTYQYL